MDVGCHGPGLWQVRAVASIRSQKPSIDSQPKHSLPWAEFVGLAPEKPGNVLTNDSEEKTTDREVFGSFY
jgi:hypothetical protein